MNSWARRFFQAESLSSQSLITTTTSVALSLLGFVSGFLLARLLGPEGRGELAAIQIYPTLLSAVAMIGVTEALVYYSAKEPDNSGRWLLSGMVITVTSALIFCALGYIAVPYVLGAQSPSVILTSRICLFLIAVNATVGLLSHSVRGLGKVASWNVMRLLPGIMWVAVILLAWLSRNVTPEGLALGYLLGSVLLGIPLVWIANRVIARPRRVDVRRWLPLLGYGVPSALAFLPTTLNLRLDQMLMAGLFATRQLGLYVVAVSWSNVLVPVAVSGLQGVLTAHVAAKDLDGSERAARVAGAVRFTILLLPPLVILSALVTPVVLPLVFGSAFVAAVPTSLVLIVAAAVMALNGVMESGMRGLGFPVDILYAELIGLLFTGALLLIFLRPLGIMGAAIASVISYAAVAAFLVARLAYRTELRPIEFIVPKVVEVRAQLVRARKALLRP